MDAQLSIREREALLKLGSFGPGAAFDQVALGHLFGRGLIEVESRYRRLILTDAGRELYSKLSDGNAIPMRPQA